jgi:hypothetical protein
MGPEAPERPDAAAPDRPGPAAKAPIWLGLFDIAVLVLALPIFIAAGFPLAGWAAATGVWLVQRGIATLVERRAAESDDPRTRVGLITASMIARGWLVAGVIFGVGLANNDAGLAAAVLFILVFTIYFPMRMLARSYERGPSAAARSRRREPRS